MYRGHTWYIKGYVCSDPSVRSYCPLTTERVRALHCVHVCRPVVSISITLYDHRCTKTDNHFTTNTILLQVPLHNNKLFLSHVLLQVHLHFCPFSRYCYRCTVIPYPATATGAPWPFITLQVHRGPYINRVGICSAFHYVAKDTKCNMLQVTPEMWRPPCHKV